MGASGYTAREARQELYEIIRTDASFEEKAGEALELCRDYLDADNGHLTRIDPTIGHWEAKVSTDSPDGRFPPGTELDLETTYCRRTIEANSHIDFHDAVEQGWADDPAYRAHGIECYHGTSLIVEGDLYGTVCFVSESAREHPFTDGESMFAELVTRLLERELEREHHERELRRHANLANVLNRVLRHNLRNDMAIIRGYTQLMADKLDNDADGKTVLRNIDQLIDLSEKARELERIVGSEWERRPTEIVPLVEDVVDAVEGTYPSATIEVASEIDISAPVMPNFDRAVEELLVNAAKHSGENPTITITVDAVPNGVEIHVSDDGPGLSEQEQAVLSSGVETPLVHGSGLGLWLVHWIVTSHDGSIDASVAVDGTTMTISLPRTPGTNVGSELSELTRARDQFEAAFEDAKDAMLFINNDARIIDANESAACIYGLDRAEILGREIPEFLPDDFDFEAAWEAFLESESSRSTVTIHNANGEQRPVEYAATTDVVPNQHLLVVRELSESGATR